MKQKIIVCDRFLDQPLEIRENKIPLTQEISNKIARLLCTNIEVVGSEFCTTGSGIFATRSVDYIGVLYLDFPTECFKKQGLSFYQHKSEIENLPSSNEMDWYGLKTVEEVEKCFDINQENDWNQYMSYFVKYNRMIIFDASLFHSYGKEDSLYVKYQINTQKV